jgi:hypothetical protein
MAEELEALLASLGESNPLGEPTPTLQRQFSLDILKVPRVIVDGEHEETTHRVDVRGPLHTLMLVPPGETSSVRAATPPPPRPSAPSAEESTPSLSVPPKAETPHHSVAPGVASHSPPPNLQPLLASFEAAIQSLRAEQLRSAQRMERALWGLGAVAILALLVALVSIVVSAV